MHDRDRSQKVFLVVVVAHRMTSEHHRAAMVQRRQTHYQWLGLMHALLLSTQVVKLIRWG